MQSQDVVEFKISKWTLLIRKPILTFQIKRYLSFKSKATVPSVHNSVENVVFTT